MTRWLNLLVRRLYRRRCQTPPKSALRSPPDDMRLTIYRRLQIFLMAYRLQPIGRKFGRVAGLGNRLWMVAGFSPMVS